MLQLLEEITEGSQRSALLFFDEFFVIAPVFFILNRFLGESNLGGCSRAVMTKSNERRDFVTSAFFWSFFFSQ